MINNLSDKTVEELNELRKQWLEEGVGKYKAIRAAIIAWGIKYPIRTREYKLYEYVVPETNMPISALAYREITEMVPLKGRWIGRESLVVTGGKYMFPKDKFREHLLCRMAFYYSVDERYDNFRYESMFNIQELTPITDEDPFFIPGDWVTPLYERGKDILITNLSQKDPALEEKERRFLLDELLSGINL